MLEAHYEPPSCTPEECDDKEYIGGQLVSCVRCCPCDMCGEARWYVTYDPLRKKKGAQ